MLRFFLQLFLVGLVLAGGYFGYRALTLETTKPQERQRHERVWTVDVLNLNYRDYQPSLTAYGRIETTRRQALRTQAGGVLVPMAIPLLDGLTVQEGQILAQVDPLSLDLALEQADSQVEQANSQINDAQKTLDFLQAQLAQDQERLGLAEADLQRVEKLAASGFSSRASIDAAKNTQVTALQTLTNRRQSIATQHARLTQAEQNLRAALAAKEQSRESRQNSLITAPFDGTLTQVDASPGQVVSSQHQIALLSDHQNVQVRFELDEGDYASLLNNKNANQNLIDQNIQVTWQAGAITFDYQAEISRISPTLQAQTAAVTLYADLKATSTYPLPPLGSFVSLSLPDRLYQHVLRIPVSALHAEGQVFTLVTQEENTRLQSHKITILRYDGDFALIQSDTLVQGDQLMTTNLPLAGDGLQVKTADQNEETAPLRSSDAQSTAQ